MTNFPLSIEKNLRVRIHYKLTNCATQETIEDTHSAHPVAYLHGHYNLLPALEEALEGLQEGDSVSVELGPEDAYGRYDSNLIIAVPKSDLADLGEIYEGMEVELVEEFSSLDLNSEGTAEEQKFDLNSEFLQSPDDILRVIETNLIQQSSASQSTSEQNAMQDIHSDAPAHSLDDFADIPDDILQNHPNILSLDTLDAEELDEELDEEDEDEDSEEEVSIFTVRKIKKDSVILDQNHPLAGLMLRFDIEIVSIDTPSIAEIEQGFLFENQPGDSKWKN
jgi:FKBP-type peptidyl-prolyl cis-trans isomerase 2